MGTWGERVRDRDSSSRQQTVSLLSAVCKGNTTYADCRWGHVSRRNESRGLRIWNSHKSCGVFVELIRMSYRQMFLSSGTIAKVYYIWMLHARGCRWCPTNKCCQFNIFVNIQHFQMENVCVWNVYNVETGNNRRERTRNFVPQTI